MHKKWEENRHKELIDKRNNEEYLEMMNNWAVNKGRMEKEINRRYDSKAFGSKKNKIILYYIILFLFNFIIANF